MKNQITKLSIIIVSAIFLLSSLAVAGGQFKGKNKTQPPGYEQGKKTGWKGEGAPPGQTKEKMGKKQKSQMKGDEAKAKEQEEGEKVEQEADLQEEKVEQEAELKEEKTKQEAEIQKQKKKKEAEMKNEQEKVKSYSKKKKG